MAPQHSANATFSIKMGYF